MLNKRKDYLKNVKRIIIKIGTSTLTHKSGLLNIMQMEKVVRQIADLHNKGYQIVFITSGAIGAGMGKLGLKERPKTIPKKQAAAAVGQGILMHMYEKLFSEYGVKVAQILLTKEDTTDRERFLNSRNSFFSLFDYGVIPIVNENDAIVVDEIKFGDNDTLSALVGSLIDGDLLVILSDIEGLYTDNPSVNKAAKLISFIEKITDEIEDCCSDTTGSLGTGGMITKIQAGKIATKSGMAMVIANGNKDGVLYKIIDGEEIGTWFNPNEKALHAKKRWLAFGTEIKGKIIIDDGASRALIKDQKSLLPSGIIDIEGNFNEGQIVLVVDSYGNEIGRGITNYNYKELNILKGSKTWDIDKIIPFKNYDEIIHRDNMVITKY